ncbi:MAG: FIG000875: Thioredoxin domain-containing protein EC-YbbN, partial [uncultured Acetobacteraceae bacterium]
GRHLRPEPPASARWRRRRPSGRRHQGRRPEDLHAGRGGGQPPSPGAGRFLGDLVRPVQGADARHREGGARRGRAGEAGQDRHRQEQGAGAATRAARLADAIRADRRRLLAGPDRRPVPGRAARKRDQEIRRGPAEDRRRADAGGRPAGRGQGRRGRGRPPGGAGAVRRARAGRAGERRGAGRRRPQPDDAGRGGAGVAGGGERAAEDARPRGDRLRPQRAGAGRRGPPRARQAGGVREAAGRGRRRPRGAHRLGRGAERDGRPRGRRRRAAGSDPPRSRLERRGGAQAVAEILRGLGVRRPGDARGAAQAFFAVVPL